MAARSVQFLIKTFITGIVIGVAGFVAALYAVPAVDLSRETSIIAVSPNGGNAETFHINIPMDRIMVGDPAGKQGVPPGVAWPEDPVLDGVRAEVFKVRNSRNAVIGVASRLAAESGEFGNVIEWVVHLPARGSLFVTLEPASGGGGRTGPLRAGTREFETIVGTMRERWVTNTSAEADAPAGRIELVATFVSSELADSDGEREEAE